MIVPNVESLACRVLHAEARTFDGRNHLVYYSRATLSRLLESAGFELVHVTTKVPSLEPVLRHLAHEDPYGEAEPRDALAQWVEAHRDAVEEVMTALDLGYKLHCLAIR